MCGISGILNIKDSILIHPDQLTKMIGILNHRGPDEAGIYVDDWIGLGHARLSIIDLSSGTQPIHNEDKTLWIIFNGEIFNYTELRKELIKEGHKFYTTSDTEVLLHLYESKGSECLNLLNGQFAFAIWDTKNKELFLARDRVGIRPLFYTINNGQFFFSSEIKALFTEKRIPREIDPHALDQTFTFWTTLKNKTIFRNIYELHPGHYLKICNGSVTVNKFWDITFSTPDKYLNISEGEIIEAVRELMLDAIRIRLRADVPVGSYLSGGLDSSGVTALIKNHFNNQLHTFGIRFEEKNFDEGKFQNLMVSTLKTDHTEVNATNNSIASAFNDVIWHCEKPILRTSPVPLYLLSNIVNQSGFKVVITGEGGDEIFAGYNIFRETKVRQFWAKQPNSKYRPLLLARLYPYILNDPKLKLTLKSFFGNQIDQPDDPFFSHIIRWKNMSRLKTFFSAELKSAIGNYNCYDDILRELPNNFHKWDYLAKAQYLEMVVFLSNYLLSSQGDRMAMANSVEIRLPYLDFRIIEFMSKVPPGLKITGLNEKSLLKKVFTGVLPEEIVKRPKHPYRAPIKQSMLNGKIGLFEHTCSNQSLNDAALFDVSKVNKLVSKLKRFDRSGEFDNMALIGILSMQTIHDQYIKNFSYISIPTVSIKLMVDHRSTSRKN